MEVPRGGVGIATLPRDRFGDLVMDTINEGTGDYQLPKVDAELVTASFEPPASGRVWINADGLGKEARLRITLLDHLEKPVPGFTAIVDQSGFQSPVKWTSEGRPPARTRLRVAFEGGRRTDIRLSAIYLGSP
jgi:hypothetical protein